MYTDLWSLKGTFTSEEFLSGYALLQALPGPIFAFTPYIGTLAMRDYGFGGQFLGSFVGYCRHFFTRYFSDLLYYPVLGRAEKIPVIKASLEGINAVSSGMVCAAAILLFHPLETTWINVGIVVATFCLLLWTKIPAPFLIAFGLLLGLIR